MRTTPPAAVPEMAVIETAIRELPLAAGNKSRAVSVLARLLAPLPEHEAPIAYRPYSRLTPAGFPVEFSFGNPAGEIRYVTEVGGPDTPNHGRLDLAWRRLAALSAGLDIRQAEWAAGLQAGHGLKYGAWAGVRHRDGGDRFKLYVESPSGSHVSALQACAIPPHAAHELTARGARLTMLGLTDQGEIEFYFGVNGLRYRELSAIFGWFGCQDRAAHVVEAIEMVCGRFLNRAARNRQNGFSAKQAEGGAWCVSFFAQTHDLFDSGSYTRQALLRAAGPIGCDLTSYEVFSRPASEEFEFNRHCMLSFTPLPDGRMDLRVGISPWA